MADPAWQTLHGRPAWQTCMADLADLADLADPIRQDSACRMADPIDRQQAALARQLPKTIEQLLGNSTGFRRRPCGYSETLLSCWGPDTP